MGAAPWSAAFQDQVRFWVYAKWGVLDICAGTCEAETNPVLCPAALAIGRPTVGTADDSPPEMPPDNFPNLGAGDSDPAFALMAGDDVANSGLGNDMVLGGEGDDIISDHDGHDVLKGQEGSDILISRHGGDILYGGGPYPMASCADLSDTMGVDDAACDAVTDVELCGTIDDEDFATAEKCCMCGGGEVDGDVTEVAAVNAEGDCDTYVIYPTHEKEHHFDWTPVNYNVGMTGPNAFTCTKILGMTLTDMIEFRLDDPNYEDYKYTDLDDTCALDIDGWEINWYLGSSVTPPDDDGIMPFAVGTNVLDIWFSRKTQMAHICLGQPEHATDKCMGGPDGEVSNDYCLAYWVQCKDKDPWPDLLLDDYSDTLDILQWYGYW